MQFKCDCCGDIEDVPQRGAEDDASCIEPNDPPDGWRAIYTIIEEHYGDGRIRRSAGEVLYSCADCNSQIDVDEHHEAEHANRHRAMWTPGGDPSHWPPISKIR